jgi:hypothetical protein
MLGIINYILIEEVFLYQGSLIKNLKKKHQEVETNIDSLFQTNLYVERSSVLMAVLLN